MYNIGDIFYLDEDYINKSNYCDEHSLIIIEIEPDEKGRRFQIQEVPKRTEKETALLRIEELKSLLTNEDFKTIKFIQGKLSQEEFDKVVAQCDEWRKEINELEAKYGII